MMPLSKEQKNIVFAYKKGYRVDKEGNVFFDGKKRSLYKSWNKTKTRAYFTFCIRNEEGYSRPIKVHKLQAYQKFGDKIFQKKVVVRHLNDDSLDNSFSNIDIGTMSENMFDMPSEKRKALAMHAASFNIRYDAEKVKEYYHNCRSYKKTMERFCISSKSTLSNILKNR